MAFRYAVFHSFISKNIYQGPKYNPIWAGRRAGLGLIIFSKEGLIVHNLYSGSIGTGLLGLYGNKVASMTKSSLNNRALLDVLLNLKWTRGKKKLPLFHLSILILVLMKENGTVNGELRNQVLILHSLIRLSPLDHILSSLLLHSFPDPDIPLFAYNFLDEANKNIPKSPLISILPQDTEVIWYFGDLNFRMRGSKSDWAFGNTSAKTHEQLPKRSEILNLIEKKEIDLLLEKDELVFLRKAKHGVLSQFSEAPIKFLPSYKFQTGKTKKVKDEPSLAGERKDREYSAKRIPAYCDRILYYSDSRHVVTSLHYTRISDYSWSDHDPVVGMFHLEQVIGIGEKKISKGRNSLTVIQARLLRAWYCNYRYLIIILICYLVKVFLRFFLKY